MPVTRADELDALAERVICEPAECDNNCADPFCPYIHVMTWRAADGSQHLTEEAARAHASIIREAGR